MTFRVPARLAHYTIESPGDPANDDSGLRVFLRHVPGGQTLVLSDVACLIWHLAAEGVPDVPMAVAETVEEPVETVRTDVDDYLDTLVAQGLLERCCDEAPP